MPRKKAEKAATAGDASSVSRSDVRRDAADKGRTSRARARPEVVIHFSSDWDHSIDGELTAGGRLTIDYDPDRLPRRNDNGEANWDVRAHVRFHPAGHYETGSLVKHAKGAAARPLMPARPAPYKVAIPEDATELEIWFESSDARGSTEWDSSYGANYWFEVASK